MAELAGNCVRGVFGNFVLGQRPHDRMDRIGGRDQQQKAAKYFQNTVDAFQKHTDTEEVVSPLSLIQGFPARPHKPLRGMFRGRKSPSARAARVWRGLYRRALDRTIGTEHTAVPGPGPQQNRAGFAFVEPKTGVSWHGLFVGVSAFWASDA